MQIRLASCPMPATTPLVGMPKALGCLRPTLTTWRRLRPVSGRHGPQRPVPRAPAGRLRMPLPLAPRRCACYGQLDPLGDHRAACATSGALSTRALPLEHAVADCREAGARSVRLADMNFDVPVADARRIEVVANGLPLCGMGLSWPLAVDATIVIIVAPLDHAAGPGPPPRRSAAPKLCNSCASWRGTEPLPSPCCYVLPPYC